METAREPHTKPVDVAKIASNHIGRYAWADSGLGTVDMWVSVVIAHDAEHVGVKL
jgi:hypothetical protein